MSIVGPTLFFLETMSERGLLLLKTIFYLQDRLDLAQLKDAKKREQAAELLRKMSKTLEQLEHEIRGERKNFEPILGKMRVYLAAFKPVFSPLIGDEYADHAYSVLGRLFLSVEGEEPEILDGFRELQRMETEDTGMASHNNAAIATLLLASEQLNGMADIIEFPEAFRHDPTETPR